MTQCVSVIVIAISVLQCGRVEGDSATASGIWSKIQVGATNAADSVTSFFSSSKSEAEENGHCISNDGGCHIGPAAKRGDEVAAVMKTGAHSVVGYFADAFEGMKKKISTSASELFDSVRTAMRSVLYEELGKLFTPDLSTPGRLLLNSINILPEPMQTLILFGACLAVALVIMRYFSVWWGLVLCALIYVYYRLLGPYQVIRIGVIGMETVMRWIGYAFQYPMLSAVIIVLLVVCALCWPLWRWYWAYKLAKKQDELYNMVYSTHETVLRIQRRQDELIKAILDIQEKLANK